MATDITFEITRHYGVISSEKNGWTREINLVSWNGGEPKFDVRSWNGDHTRMTRGITLSYGEAARLVSVLGSVL